MCAWLCTRVLGLTMELPLIVPFLKVPRGQLGKDIPCKHLCGHYSDVRAI